MDNSVGEDLIRENQELLSLLPTRNGESSHIAVYIDGHLAILYCNYKDARLCIYENEICASKKSNDSIEPKFLHNVWDNNPQNYKDIVNFLQE